MIAEDKNKIDGAKEKSVKCGRKIGKNCIKNVVKCLKMASFMVINSKINVAPATAIAMYARENNFQRGGKGKK